MVLFLFCYCFEHRLTIHLETELIQIKLVQMKLKLYREKTKKKQRGATMLAKLTRVCNSYNRLSIEFKDLTWTYAGEHLMGFKS